MTYFCSECGIEHDDFNSLAIAFDAPIYYTNLSKEERNNRAKLGADFCIIHYEDQTDRFIRCVLSQKILNSCQELEYGLWVSVSEKSHQDYWDNFNNEEDSTNYFGWISNSISEYKDIIKVPVKICVLEGNQRPEIIPDENFEHPFVEDYYNGITEEEAKRRISHII
ncbi:DUF2199 domain-containing protein [Bernardetia sp. OM2101]|uniref:DUF2199 domain-containing protein n=1 Tax=Bernardetia sp. OM2101 TaxID=3344876 RepID=UPI0035CF3CCB